MKNNKLSISIEFYGNEFTCPQKVSLQPKDYFNLDASKESGEFDIDSIPQFDHASEYLQVEKRRLRYTLLKISDSKSGREKAIREFFWNNGECVLIQRCDVACNQDYSELIIHLKTGDTPSRWQILRLVPQNKYFEVCLHIDILEKHDGTEDKKIIYSGS